MRISSISTIKDGDKIRIFGVADENITINDIEFGGYEDCDFDIGDILEWNPEKIKWDLYRDKL